MASKKDVSQEDATIQPHRVEKKEYESNGVYETSCIHILEPKNSTIDHEIAARDCLPRPLPYPVKPTQVQIKRTCDGPEHNKYENYQNSLRMLGYAMEQTVMETNN